MDTLIANPHTAEELAAVSTLVHNIVGVGLLGLSAAQVVEVARGAAGRARYVWPALGAVTGLGLAAFVFLHQVFTHGVPPFADPVQNQHQLIGLFAGGGGALELARRAGRVGPMAAAAWPMALVAIAAVFFGHEQGTTAALVDHLALAGTLVVAGLAALAPIVARGEGRTMRAFAALMLGVAATQLVAYDEAPGAHAEHAAPAGEHAGP